MEVKSITELEDAIRVNLEGSVDISKDTIRQWYEEYCTGDNEHPDFGKLEYRIGLASDLHFNFDKEENKDSEYEEDLRNALDYYNKQGVDLIASCGDLCEYNDKDLTTFSSCYKNASSLPFYTCLGNHDYLKVYHKRTKSGDKTQAQCEQMWKDNVDSLRGSVSLHYFNDGTYKGKLNYWFTKDNDMFIFISIDYGESTGSPWDDVARGFYKLDYDNRFVQQMNAYVRDTKYNRDRETNFDYQYYNPEVLMWLKNLIENNPNKRKFLFMHHPLSNKAGDTFGVYSHLRVWPYPTSEALKNKYYSGSNMPTGITFWFLDKLLCEAKNLICFTGHTHFAWKEQEDMITREYDVKQPTGKEITPLVNDINTLDGTAYDYRLYTPVGHSIKDCATTIHLPSLSKPSSKEGKSLYGASEGAVMEVYERGIIIRQIVFKKEGSSSYINNEISSKQISMTGSGEEPPTQEGITFRLQNNTGQDIRYSGKLQLYVKTGTANEWKDTMPAYLNPPDDNTGGYPHWTKNSHTLKQGEYEDFLMTEVVEYTGNGKTVTKTTESLDNYADNQHYFVAADKGTFNKDLSIPAIKLGCYVYDSEKKDYSNSAFMLHVKPIETSEALIREGVTYILIIDQIKSNASFDPKSGKKYIIV